MPYRRRLGLLALSTALPLVLVAMAAARAEDIKLDEITVSSPSPIVARPTGPVTGAGSAFPTGVLPVVTGGTQLPDGARIGSVPATETGVRDGLEGALRALARDTPDLEQRVALVNRANAVRNWSLT